MVRPKSRIRTRGLNVKRVLAAVILGCGCAVFVSFDTIMRAETPPNPQQVQFAQRTSDLMLATLFAARLQEFSRDYARQRRGGEEIDFPHLQRPQRRYAPRRRAPAAQGQRRASGFVRGDGTQSCAARSENFTAVEKVEGKLVLPAVGRAQQFPSCVRHVPREFRSAGRHAVGGGADASRTGGGR